MGYYKLTGKSKDGEKILYVEIDEKKEIIRFAKKLIDLKKGDCIGKELRKKDKKYPIFLKLIKDKQVVEYSEFTKVTRTKDKADKKKTAAAYFYENKNIKAHYIESVIGKEYRGLLIPHTNYGYSMSVTDIQDIESDLLTESTTGFERFDTVISNTNIKFEEYYPYNLSFYFDVKKAPLVGKYRHELLNVIVTEFVNSDHRISISTIYGPLGSGRSKLAYHVKLELEKKGWKTIWIDWTKPDGYFEREFEDTEENVNVLIVFDDMNYYPLRARKDLLKVLTEKKTGTKIRIICTTRFDRLPSECLDLLCIENGINCYYNYIGDMEESEWLIIFENHINAIMEERNREDKKSIIPQEIEKYKKITVDTVKRFQPQKAAPLYVKMIANLLDYNIPEKQLYEKLIEYNSHAIVSEMNKIRVILRDYGAEELYVDFYRKQIMLILAVSTMVGGMLSKEYYEIPQIKDTDLFFSNNRKDQYIIIKAITGSVFLEYLDQYACVPVINPREFAVELCQDVLLHNYIKDKELSMIVDFLLKKGRAEFISFIDDSFLPKEEYYRMYWVYNPYYIGYEILFALKNCCYNILYEIYQKNNNKLNEDDFICIRDAKEYTAIKKMYQESVEQYIRLYDRLRLEPLNNNFKITKEWIRIMDQFILVDTHENDAEDFISKITEQKYTFFQRPYYAEIDYLFVDSTQKVTYAKLRADETSNDDSQKKFQRVVACVSDKSITCETNDKLRIVSYEGDVLLGLPHGNGIAKWSNGVQYQGTFFRGSLTGFGEFVHYDSDGRETRRYSCSLLYGFRHGNGTYIWEDGYTEYDGGFTFGLRHGQGIMKYKNGTVLVGEWYQDRFQGEYPDGVDESIDEAYRIPTNRGPYSTTFEERGSIINNYK